jgi:ribA/ribD-fused uncharacterized protein
MKITDKYIFFWGGIYSQWYPADMVIDYHEYNTCEQYMMHQKALLFNDTEIAEKIMREWDPREQKSLGRQVRNFDRVKWDKYCLSFVFNGNLAKFTQNEDLKNELLATGDRILVEASPEDFIWGIGMDEFQESIDNPLSWRGMNLLGQAITLVRHEIKKNK